MRRCTLQVGGNKARWLTCGRCLLFGLLVLAVGCSSGPKRSIKHVDVTGKVLYKDRDGTYKPVTGGEVTFVTVEGGFSSNGRIEEDGTYKINAPVGPVKISVNNQMLRDTTAAAKTGGMGAGKVPNRPEQFEKDPVQGKFMALPPKYASPETSGLTYEVKNESNQSFDIKLD